MTSAAITQEQAPAAVTGAPAWLWRVHTWWFAGQVLANVMAAGLITRLIGEPKWGELGLGLLLGQGFLLSVWLALGGLPNVARFISVSFITLASGLVVGHEASSLTQWEDWILQATQIFIVCFFMVLLFHGLLLPLRWLLGWRLDFDPAYHAPERTGRMQIGVMHFLGWTTFLAIPCAVIRLLPAEEVAEICFICLSVSAMTLPIAAVFAMAAVARRTVSWMLFAAATFGVMLTAELFIPDLVFDENFLQFNLGIVTAVGGNLLVLRCMGLKLFSVAQPATAAVPGIGHAPHFQPQPANARIAA